MSVPPEVMQMIDQASQGGPDTPGPIDASAGMAPTPADGGPSSDMTPVEALEAIRSAIEQYQAVETDDVDLEKAARMYQLCQQLLADNQRQQEQAAGVTPVHKGLAKLQGQGGGY